MRWIDSFSENLGFFIADRPFTMLFIVFCITIASFYGNTLLKNESMDTANMLPKDIPVVKSMNYISDEFGGAESALIVVEANPVTLGSNEVRDVRDPRVLNYVDLLAQKVTQLEDVVSATSEADLVKVDGRIAQSQNTINDLMSNNPQAGSYLSGDYSMTLVRLKLVGNFDKDALARDMNSILEETPKPPGLTAKGSGDFVVSTSIRNQIAPDMAKTAQYSLLGVLVIVVLIFTSVRYGLISLLAITFGTIWSFGLMGLFGMSVTSQTSGAASMIMGIGIDFGIQVVARFRLELAKMKIRKAMAGTMKAIIVPMGTTTLAALIGFRAMSMGQLTILSELATMMSYGILCCMLAALTIVPSALVLGEKYLKFKIKEVLK